MPILSARKFEGLLPRRCMEDPDLRETSRQLANERDRYRAIFLNMAEPAFVVDNSFRLVAVNRAFEKFFGPGEDEIKGKRCRDLLNYELCGACPLLHAMKTRSSFSDVEASMSLRGEEKKLLVSGSFLDEGGGESPCGIVVIEDITERKKVEEELALHKNQLKQLVREHTAEFVTAINFLQDEIEFRKLTEEALRENEAKMRHLHGMKVLGELAAGVAHEVRNPLHALMSVTEALKKELKDNPDYDIFLFHIREQVERLAVLMKDLLDLGKPIEPSHLRPEPLYDICLVSIDLWKKSPSRRDHTVSFVQPAAEKVIITGDSQRLQQVFLNLLENAAHHSPEGSEIQVVMAAPGEDSVSVKVIDRGSGISEDILPRIFESFFTTRRRGTGLGLSIIKNILEGHGGSLAVRNNVPLPGCTAEVILPFVKETML